MSKLINEVGNKYGRLTVLKYAEKEKRYGEFLEWIKKAYKHMEGEK